MSLIMFQSVGERLNTFLRFLIIKVKKNQINIKNWAAYKWNKCINNEQNKLNHHCESSRKFTVSNKELLFTEVSMTIIFCLFASYIFSVYEGWSYFDSNYYSFITLTTIGFGDLVPLRKTSENHPFYVLFTLFFINFGLVIVASSTNLLVVYIANINSEEKLRETLDRRQKKQEKMQRILIGDVIKSRSDQMPAKIDEEVKNKILSTYSSILFF
jgi:hypothetical protein